jgi:transposase-like protein
MRGRTVRTTSKRRRFLSALAGGVSVSAAARAAGLGRSSVYDWRDDDPDFEREWISAEEESVDLLEDAARARALSPQTPGSTACLLFLMTHRRPSVYRAPRATAAVVPMAPEDLRAIEEARRIREMSAEEIEAEVAEINRRHEIADAARAEVFPGSARGNGSDH